MDDAQRPERNLEVSADSEQDGDCGSQAPLSCNILAPGEEADMRHRHLELTEMIWMDWKQDSSKQSWDSDSTKLSYLVRVSGSGGEQVILFALLSLWIDTCDYHAYIWALWLDALCWMGRIVVLNYFAGETEHEHVFTVVVVLFSLWIW